MLQLHNSTSWDRIQLKMGQWRRHCVDNGIQLATPSAETSTASMDYSCLVEKKKRGDVWIFYWITIFLMHNNTIIINTKAPDGWKYCLPYIWSLHRLTFYTLALRRSNRGDVSARHVSRRRVWTWGRGSICSRQPLTAHSAETVSAGGLRHWSCPRAFV